MNRNLENSSVEILKTYPLRGDYSANLTSNVSVLGWQPGDQIKIFIDRKNGGVWLQRVEQQQN